MLATHDIHKSYGSVVALRGVSVRLAEGEVTSLVGENGSGKSTLLAILAGVQTPDAGTVELDGRRMRFAEPRDALDSGVALVPQDLLLGPHLSVAENIWLGHLPRATVVTRRRIEARAEQLLSTLLGSRLDVSRPLDTLRPDEQALVAIARACAWEPRVLLLDEVTAGLGGDAVQRVLDLMERLRENGTAIVFVSHRLKETMQIADRAIVLRDGVLVAARTIGETDEGELVRLMVGRELPDFIAKQDVALGPPRLEVRDLRLRPNAQPTSFEVRSGEIVGIAGLAGSGRSRLARVLAGVEEPSSGAVYVDGHKLRPGDVPAALAHGIGLLPEDRKGSGLLLAMSIRENISLSILRRLRRWGVLDRRREQAIAVKLREQLAIKAPSVDAPVRNLSGGNQQKVVVARLLAAEAQVLVLDEPTKGIDVGAKAEIFRLIGNAAHEGQSIVFISSELPEVLGVADRVLVLHDGAVAAQLPREQLSEERVVAAAVGATLS